MSIQDREKPHISIPDADFANRRAALSQQLLATGVEAWIAIGDDGAVAGPGHIRYLTDIAPHFEPVLLLRRADGAELLIVGPETLGYANAVPRPSIRNTVVATVLGHASEEYPSSQMVDGATAIVDFLKGVQSIGLIGWERTSHGIHSQLAAALGEGRRKVSDANDVAFGQRSVKSAAEQAVIDEAYRIARAGLLAAATAIRPNVTERSIAAEAEAAMRREGAEGFGIDTMVASGVRNTQPIISRSTHRLLQKDDLIAITVAPRYEGYHAALARPFLLERNPNLEGYIGVALDAQTQCFEALQVGRQGRDAEMLARSVVHRGKTGADFPYVGVHSLGVVEFEPPIFTSHSAETIKPGMALSIDIPLYHAPWGGFRIEDGFAVEAERVRPRILNYRELAPLIL